MMNCLFVQMGKEEIICNQGNNCDLKGDSWYILYYVGILLPIFLPILTVYVIFIGIFRRPSVQNK